MMGARKRNIADPAVRLTSTASLIGQFGVKSQMSPGDRRAGNTDGPRKIPRAVEMRCSGVRRVV